MKLLFAYNANFKKDVEGNYYTGGSINEEMWERYAKISDELNIISRLDKCEYDKEYAKKKFNIFDNSTKNFIAIPNLNSSIMDFFNLKLRNDYDKIIKENVKNNDLIIVRIPSNVGNTAIKYAKKYNKPYLVEVVGCAWDAFWNHSVKGKIIAPYNYYQEKKNISNAPYAIYVTNEFLQNRYPNKGQNTNCSNVSLIEFDDNIIKKRLEKIKNIKNEDKIVLGTTAGVAVRFKGQQYVIEAIGKLKAQGITKFEYQLVGGGDQSYLKSVAKKYGVSEEVKFLGAMPHENVFAWLDMIDIYVQPSRQEGLPRALIEAMSRSLPAFGAKTGGIPELILNDYIFSNTRHNIDEICDILKNFNIETMSIQAKTNYEKSKEYAKDIIEKRRKEFFIKFAEAR